ncbi:MAG TPA: metallophosphoesterase [Planctomycetota bacterium]|nr:metallophosphoesterase [Planctomycetota bacterium]
MPVTFIGDVHGWSDRLERVLAQVDGDLVFMGDLIDRGPAAPAVLDRVHTLCDQGRARCVMGNHEYAMVRGLGCDELGIAAEPAYLHAWAERYGGDAVLDSYGIGDVDAVALRHALGRHLRWLAALPWLLRGTADGRAWYAVHAGFDDSAIDPQIADLERSGEHMRRKAIEQPPPLYAKQRSFLLPRDLPLDACIVSGHTPQRAALVTASRILCDTSGGQRGRVLSAVRFPDGLVVTG